jgi:hypothetical protein
MKEEIKEPVLWGVTSWAVTFVRHGIQHNFKGWDSWGDFFIAWFIHLAALGLFFAFAAATIIHFHKFWLGIAFPYNTYKDGDKAVRIYILLTVLIATIGIAMVATAGPFEDD